MSKTATHPLVAPNMQARVEAVSHDHGSVWKRYKAERMLEAGRLPVAVGSASFEEAEAAMPRSSTAGRGE